MDIGNLPELASGFVSLLLLPTLGVVGLMNKRAIPVLGWTLVGWAIAGGIALWTHHTWKWTQGHFERTWVLGLGLGSAFLLIALLNQDRRAKPWIRLALTLVTVAVFARSLLEFVRRFS